MSTKQNALYIKPCHIVKAGSKAAHVALGLDVRDLKNLDTPAELFPARSATVRGRTVD